MLIELAVLAIAAYLIVGFLLLTDYYHQDFSKFRKGDQWRNWNDTVHCHPEFFEQPDSEERIKEIVQKAGQEGRKVKVCGASMAFGNIVGTSDYLLNLDKLNRVLKVEGNQVTVEAGIRVCKLIEELEKLGLALPTVGCVPYQSISGVVQTASHSGGKCGSFATYVSKIRMVTGTGEVITSSKTENPDIFHASVVGVGVMGICTQITLDCCPMYNLRSEEKTISLNEFLANWKSYKENHDYFFSYWIPDANQVRVQWWTKTDAPAPTGLKVVIDDYRKNFRLRLRTLMFWISAMWPLTTPFLNKAVASMPPAVVVDRWHRTLVSGTPSGYNINFEYNFPAENFVECLQAFMKSFNDKSNGINFNTLIPIRFVEGDEYWISQFYKRETVAMSFTIYFQTEKEVEKFQNTLEPIGRKLGGRPHWGKVHSLNYKDFEALYPKWNDFTTVRRQLDPQNVFLSNTRLCQIFEQKC